MFFSYFKQHIKDHNLKEDAVQDHCARIIDQCILLWQKPKWQKIFKEKTYGLYIYGHIGSGKTTLMDCMAQYVQEKSVRQHYKFFMINLHKNGFEETITTLKNVQFLFLDELDIIDIADAMIIQRLFIRLKNLGVYIITTSNLPPALLYKNGLHYDRFEPFAPYLENHFTIFNLDNGIDYRMQKEESGSCIIENGMPIRLILLDKAVDGLRSPHGLILNFDDICSVSLGPVHYKALCETESIIHMKNVPAFDKENTDALRRFITLVDMIYDQNKKLMMWPTPYIHVQNNIDLPIARLQSRLYEMAKTSVFLLYFLF